MTRIVAGSARGRRLTVPPRGTRPTSERAREALFSSLEHLGVVEDCAVLDLFAGSGALGLEAASRGASRVVLVDMARSAINVLKKNVAQVRDDVQDVTVVQQRAGQFLTRASGDEDESERFDLVFIDPPYDFSDHSIANILAALADNWLHLDAVVVVERGAKAAEPQWPPEWEPRKPRKYGDARLWIARAG